jgi:hypothetical protein
LCGRRSDQRVGDVAVCCSAAAARVCMRCAPAVCGGHALRACCVCRGPMLIRHETCASVWACAGQRHFVPRTYPGPLNPLSPPSGGPQRGEPAVLAAVGCWSGEKRPTHCAADRLKTRRCIAVSPNRRATQRGPPTGAHALHRQASTRIIPPFMPFVACVAFWVEPVLSHISDDIVVGVVVIAVLPLCMIFAVLSNGVIQRCLQLTALHARIGEHMCDIRLCQCGLQCFALVGVH